MKDNESDLFKRYRIANQMAGDYPLLVRGVHDTVHVTSTTRTSYTTYDTRRMNLVFCGPMFSRIHCTYQRDDVVYVGSYRNVYATARGEVVRCFSLPTETGSSNKRIRVSEESMEGVVKQIVGFGEVVLILTQSELFVTEDLNEVYKVEHSDISMVFHPHAYVNKVVKVLSGGGMTLYNVVSRKEIYTYKPFECAVAAIEQSPVVDVVGIGLEDGTIHVFNLRTDKTLFSLKAEGRVVSLSFGGRYLMAVADGGMSIFDLDKKKKVIRMGEQTDGGGDFDENSREGHGYPGRVLSGRFLDDKSLVVSTKDSLTIYEVRDYTLELIKSRRTYNDEIVGMEFVDEKNVALFGPRSVFNMNMYSDEQNFMFKFKGHIEMMDVNKNIVCFGRRRLHVLNFAEKNSRLILNKTIKCLAVYKDFCCFGGDGVTLINLKSRLVHSKFDVDGELVDLAMDFTRIVAATASGIHVYTSKGKLVSRHEQEGIVSIRLVENFVVACTKTQVLFYDEGVSREFSVGDEITDYCVSADSKWVAVLCKHKVFVYDILTTTLLDMLAMSDDAKFIRFSPNLDFLLAVSGKNDLVLFSNKSNFQSSIKPEEVVLNFSVFAKENKAREAVWRRRRGTLYSELLLLRGLKDKPEQASEAAASPEPTLEMLGKLLDEDWIRGLRKEEVLKVIELITPHLSTSADIAQRILFSVLRYKSHLLEAQDIHKFNETFARAWDEFEESALRTIGYLSIEADGLLE